MDPLGRSSTVAEPSFALGAAPVFRVLGPLEIRDCNGRPVSPFRRKQRTLLAFLILRAGYVVSTDEIVDTLWGDRAPASALANLYSYVSALRQLLNGAAPTGETRPRTMPSGYQLDLRPGECDAEVFERLAGDGRRALAEGRHATAADLLARALDLWRGDVLEGMERHEWLLPFAGRLEEARLAAVEDRIDAHLALGEHAELTTELVALTAHSPLRERLWRQLMVALYRSGSKPQALQVYDRLRDNLDMELGVRPSAEVRKVFDAIVRDDPALGAPPGLAVVRPVQLPAAPAPFVGRAERLRRLDELIDGTPGGDPDAMIVCTVSGPPGVGKTALVVHWAHRVADRFPDGQLYVNLRGFGPARQVMAPGEAIRGFLDALGVPPERVPASAEAQAGLYRSVLAGRRILIVVDNARDAPQVRPLLPGISTALVVVTSRNQLTPLLAIDGAQPLSLDLFTCDEARELLTRRLAADPLPAEAGAMDDIITACARLPLALGIAAARARHSGFPLTVIAAELRDAGRRLDALDGGDPASEVRAVFSWSYTALTPSSARLFRLLGLHAGPDISVSASASLADRPIPATRRLLTELSRANLIVEHVSGRYTSHDLLRAYAVDLADTQDTVTARRAGIARLLDYYTHTAYAAARLLRPQQDPIPLPLAPLSTDAGREQPADIPSAMAWLTAEHRVLLAAVRLAFEAGFNTAAWQLAWSLDTFLTRLGHWHDLVAVWKAARDAAGRIGDEAAEAHAHRLLAHAHALLGRYTEAHAAYRHALELDARAGNRAGQARTHLQLGVVWERQGRHELAVEHDRQALALYRAEGHRRGEADALNAVGWDYAQLGDHGQALVHCEQALLLHRQLGNRHGEAHTLDSVGYAHHHLGNRGQAVDFYQRAIDLFRELGDRYSEADAITHLGDTHHTGGDLTAAGTAWTRARDILDDLGHPDVEVVRARLEALGPVADGV